MCVLRMAREEDAAALLAVYAPYAEGTASFEEVAPSPEEFARRIREISAMYPYIVLEEDGQVAGYAYAHLYRQRAAYRWNVEVSIYVDAAFHRRGCGRALLSALLELLKRQGVRMAYSCITLPNAASVGLHRALGFESVGTLKDAGWKLGGWRDVHWMQLRLNDADAAPAPLRTAGEIDAAGILQNLRNG